MTEKRLVETKVTTTTTKYYDDGTEITDSVTTVTPSVVTGRAQNPIDAEAYLSYVNKVASVAAEAKRDADEAPAEVEEAIQEARPHVERALRWATEDIAYAKAIVALRDLLSEDLYDAVSRRKAAPMRSEVLAYMDATEDECAVLRQAWAFRFGLDWIEEDER